MLSRTYENFKFLEILRNNVIDIQKISTRAIKFTNKQPGLKTVCDKFFDGLKLCKTETCSNWDNRPLRKS